MNASTAPALYHCEAHGRGILATTWRSRKVTREGAGRWVREEMARSDASGHERLYHTIKIIGTKGIAVKLYNSITDGWMTTQGRVAGVPTNDEVTGLTREDYAVVAALAAAKLAA